MPGDAALSVRIDSKGFVDAAGQHRAVLRDILFEGRPGEILALFGASGTGKTTTLRTILGLERDAHATIRTASPHIGMVFQEPLLLSWLTIAENIALVVPRDRPAPDIEQLLHDVGLPGTARLRPGALSLGMTRRAALARALALRPSVLLLDEPFASLDAQRGAQLAALIAARARQDGMLVLLATHDLDQALPIATRVLILAGQPATLAADVPVGADPAALRRDLLLRFPFLAGGW